jgi:hypothetical protein
MHLLMLDWAFSLESFCRVAAWSIIVGFFGALGYGLFGFIPRRRAGP